MDELELPGRQALVDEVVAAAATAPEGVIVDLVGPHGSGRTSLLRTLRARLTAPGDALVLALNGAVYSRPADADDLGRQVEEFLTDLAEGVGEEATAPVARRRAEAAAGADEVPTRRMLSAPGVVDDLRAAAADRRLVVLVDNVSMMPDQLETEAHRVFSRLLSRCHAVVVVARTTGTAAPPDWIGPTRRWTVPPLSVAEVRLLAADRLGAAPDERSCRAVLGWSGGHLAAVTAAVDLMGRRPELTADELVRQPIPVRSVAATLGGCGAPERTVVEVGAVLREFTVPDLIGVLAVLEETPPDDIAALLGRTPFLAPGRSPDTHSFLPFFRDQVQRDLRAVRSGDRNFTRFDEINRAALRHYRERLRQTLEEPSKAYASWEQLERSDTQRLLLDLVHHGGLVDDAKYARFTLASVFFDFLWWWAWYVDAPFLTKLLRAWQSSARGPADEAFVGQLERFRRAYVPAHRDAADPAAVRTARWTDAVTALNDIRKALDLGGRSAPERHLLGITTAMLGDARRRLDPHDPRVDADYETARQAFHRNAVAAAEPGEQRVEDDGWCDPWMAFRQADLACERDQAARAQALATAALDATASPRIDDDDRDFEVIANLHRVLGDVVVEKKPEPAFREYLRAVFAAYAFHAGPQPDEYTRTFHREQVDAVMTRLRSLAERDRARAVAVCEEIVGWRLGAGAGDPRELLARRCWDELECLLFPREPRPEEFEVESDYVTRVRAVRELLGPRLLPAVPVKRGIFGVRRRAAAEPAPPTSSIAGLKDGAVEPDRFAADDDERWPRWWKDELVPQEWQLELDDGAPLTADMRRQLREAMAALPPLRRRVLELRDVKGWTKTAVSRELDISEDDQLIMLHRARAAVRRALDRHLTQERTS